MKRFLIFISLHLFLFVLVIAYQAQADEHEWSVREFDTYITTTKAGEITHGDKLRFFINKGDCSRMGILFTFSTMKNNQNLNNLQNQKNDKKNFLNLVVSKSGNTIETIVNSNILINKNDQNIFITENKKSYLRDLAEKLKSEIKSFWDYHLK